MNDHKTGWRTSEFAVVVGTAVVAFLNRKLHLGITVEEFLGVCGTVGTYVIGRSIAKRKK